jgi:hypothetical protein
MSNVLLQLIETGRIQTFDGLKAAYRKAIMKTHPDAVGSDKYLESYLKLRSQYDEAKTYFAKFQSTQDNQDEIENTNHRLSFFEKLNQIETLEMPYAFHPEENFDQVVTLRKAAMEEISGWKQELAALYRRADQEYLRLKTEKPMGPYLKHALALNVRPLVHNIIAYHLTGRELYAKQAKQNLSGIMQRLTENGCVALRDFLTLLLDDLKNGPAVLE